MVIDFSNSAHRFVASNDRDSCSVQLFTRNYEPMIKYTAKRGMQGKTQKAIDTLLL